MVRNLFVEQRAGFGSVGGFVRLFQEAERAGGSGVRLKLLCSLLRKKNNTRLRS